ncbi:MAG: T9SS type A sorting domain-containing protein, partial [candidate division WOR-3 bacterium]
KETLISFLLDSFDLGYNKVEVKLRAKKDYDTTNNYQYLELSLFRKNENFIIYPEVFCLNFDKIIKFEFSLPEKGNLDLEIFDLKGKLIKKFNLKVDKKYSLIWEPAKENLKNGIYIAVIRYKYAGKIIEEKKSFIITYGRD